MKKGTWGSTLEMMIFTYAFEIDIITIGNYLQGHIVTKASDQIRHVSNIPVSLADRQPIYLYYHTHGYHDQPTDNPNHFAYLKKYSETDTEDEETFCTESVIKKRGMSQQTLDDWNSCLRSTESPLSDKDLKPKSNPNVIAKPSEQNKKIIDLASNSSTTSRLSIHSSASSALLTQNSLILKNAQFPIPIASYSTRSINKRALPSSADSSTSSTIPKKIKGKK